MTLRDLLAVMSEQPPETPVVFKTGDGPIGAGYHVTELRLADIVGIDCGGQTSRWSETTLQLLDGQGESHMPVGKFVGILTPLIWVLASVARRRAVALAETAGETPAA